MSKERPIVYEPHPVSPKRKAELVGKGFKIIDIAFKPKDLPVEKAAQKDVQDHHTEEADSQGDLTKSEIQQLLTDAGIDFSPTAKKAELLSLLNDSQAI